MRKIISYVLSFIAAILLVISICLGIIFNTVLNSNFLVKTLEENDYYTLIDTNIKSEIEGYTKQSGLDEEVFENIYSKEQLKEDINSTIIGIYGNGKTEINADVIKENLKKNIETYLTKNNITLSSSEQKNIDDFVKKIVTIYVNEVSHPVYLEAANKAILTADRILPKVSKVIYISFAVAIILILGINIKHIKEAFSYIAISLLTAAIFISIGILILNLKINIDNILILNSAFTLLVIDIVKKIMYQVLHTALAIAVVSIIVTIIFNLKNSEKVLQKTHK